jgi:hypothetical protein
LERAERQFGKTILDLEGRNELSAAFSKGFPIEPKVRAKRVLGNAQECHHIQSGERASAFKNRTDAQDRRLPRYKRLISWNL